MKVVIFCGGFGVRMGGATESTPKPMIPIGSHPILWHIMKYYAMWGHTDFILCLGYKAEVIKNYFLSYNEAIANDFVLSEGGQRIVLVNRDIEDWTITFVDTGLYATIAERLKAVSRFLSDETVFLATYGDGLTDAPLSTMIDHFEERRCTAMFLSVRPTFNVHVVHADDDGVVRLIENIRDVDVRINGGYFIFRHEILDLIESGDELVEQPFRQLIEAEQLLAYPHDGFWAPMDTLKDKQYLDGLVASGSPPWRRVGSAVAVSELQR